MMTSKTFTATTNCRMLLWRSWRGSIPPKRRDAMGKVSPPVNVSVRRHGFRQRIISRLMFEPGPPIAGWVNYKKKVHPVFRDDGGRLFLNEGGWVAARQQPL